MTEHSWRGTISVVIGLLLCLLFVISPLFIPQVARAAPTGVTVNRYYTTWEARVETTSIDWVDPMPSTDYYPLKLTFTPPQTANYLVIGCATLSNSSTSYTTSWQFLRNTTEIQSRDFTPREVEDYVPFGCHEVVSLTGSTEYIFKMQFKTSDASGIAYMRNARIIVFQVSDYHYAEVTGETSTDLTGYVDKTTLTFTPSSAGDYLVLASCNMTINSVLHSFYTQLTHGIPEVSQGVVCRELTVASEYRSYLIARVISFGSGEQILKIQYKTENASSPAFIKNARITAVRLSDLGIDAHSADVDGPQDTNSTSYIDVTDASVTFSPSPSQYGDYLVTAFTLVNGDKTAQKAYTQLDIDGTSYGERSFRPDDTKDYIPLFVFKKYRTSPSSHTFKIQYKAESPMTVACQNARILAIKVNTLQPYSDSGITPCTTFDSANYTVNIYGYAYQYDWEASPPAAMPYKVVYYDNGGAQVQADVVNSNSNQNRSISSTYDCNTNTSASPGESWHAVVYRAKTGDPAPATIYTANDPNSTMEVTFTVEASAIPEFPTVIAGMVVAGLCFGIYYWMRKKRLRDVKA